MMEQDFKTKVNRFFQSPQDFCAITRDMVPLQQFKTEFEPFDYLPHKSYCFRDLRQKIVGVGDRTKKRPLLERVHEEWNDFKMRVSAHKRICNHTIQYTVLHSLVIWGFYSTHLKGRNRALYVLTQTLRAILYSGSFFTINEVVYPFWYKISKDKQKRPLFTPGNISALALTSPILMVAEQSVLVGMRKALFICLFSMAKDLNIEFQRLFLMEPENQKTIMRLEKDRLQHPFEDPKKELYRRNSGAIVERKKNEKDWMKSEILKESKGERIPNTNKAIVFPQIYRLPTKEESEQYEKQTSKEIARVLKERNITWITVGQKEEDKE